MGAIYLDFQKAIDNVLHQRLIQKISCQGLEDRPFMDLKLVKT